MVKIGINGFGRLGRLLLQVAINKVKEVGISNLIDVFFLLNFYFQKCNNDTARVVMVNDASLKQDNVKALLLNDSLYGKDNKEVLFKGSAIVVDGNIFYNYT